MSAPHMEVIRQRLEQELINVQRAAGDSVGEDREAFETLERVFRARLADLPRRVAPAPVPVEHVLPPVHQHVLH